ncbi:hypothetical protein HB662_28560 [Roseomonas frigidaquae]|uniref:Uncharacterized protein n=1 Tax=Falsiroseomonas frigidaquae TaxID=487318 RepID=A0ABX1F950_9PROT|nr:hypothetical protein [Falsiroseomonas frigidaquae]NKE48751.1 hypothetical protein [Falsiroseomonas frigidaquae]
MQILPRPLLPALLALLLLPGAPARAQLGETSCPELVAWAREHEVHAERDMSLGWDRLPPRQEVMLPGLFLAPATTATFGKPALEWDRQDLRTLGSRLRACARDREMRPHREVLAEAQRLVSGPASTFLQHRQRVLAELPVQLERLAQQPFAPALLPFLTTLAAAGEPAGWQAAQQDWRELPGAARGTGHQLLRLVPYLLPEDRSHLLLPELERQRAQRQAEARQASLDELAALPPNPRGLAGLEAMEQGPVWPLLRPEDRAEVVAARQARGAALLEEIEAGLRRRIAAVPASLPAFNRLAAIRRDAALAALPADRAAALTAELEERSRSLAATMLDRLGVELAERPETVESLGHVVLVTQRVTEALRPHAEAATLAAFKESSTRRIAAMAAAALPEFVVLLEAVPAAGLDSLQAPPWIAALPPPHAGRYASALADRRAKLEAAIAAERAAEAAREAGPLAGRHYATPDGAMRLEFLDSSRVLVTQAATQTTIAGSYEEIAGERLILTLPDTNVVLQRQGRRLDGGAVVLERQAAP